MSLSAANQGLARVTCFIVYSAVEVIGQGSWFPTVAVYFDEYVKEVHAVGPVYGIKEEATVAAVTLAWQIATRLKETGIAGSAIRIIEAED